MNDTTPALLLRIASSATRTILLSLTTWLVSKGYLTQDDAGQAVTIIGVALAALAWAAWQHVGIFKILGISLSLPEGSTMADVARVKKIEANGGRKQSLWLILLLCAVVVPFSACNKPEQLARGTAQAYVGLNGIADGIAVMIRHREVNPADALVAFASLNKVALTADVFSQRAQSGGYSKGEALTTANKLLADLRSLYDQNLFSTSEAAKARWQLIFFAAETGINTAKIVIARKGETKTEARKAAINAGEQIREQITAKAASRSVSAGVLTELISLAQRVTVDLVTVSLMTESEAWAYRAELAGALKTKLSQ